MQTSRSTSKRLQALAWVICGLGAVFYCYEYFLRIGPGVMETQLRDAYFLNATAFGNLVACYYYAYTPMQLVVGVLMDHYGPRRLLVMACLCCALGVYLFGSAFNLSIAQLGRFIVGFGSAFAFVGVLKLATIWLPPDRFAFISGLTTALGMSGAIIGDISLSHVVSFFGWRLTNQISAALGILLAALIFLIVKDRNPRIHYNHPAFAEHHTFKGLLIELKDLVKNPQIWFAGIISMLTFLSASVFAEVWGIAFLKRGYNLSQTAAASMTSIIFLGWIIGSPIIGWISDSIKQRRLPLIIGSLLATLCFTLLIFGNHYSYTMLVILLFGIGFFSTAQILVFAIACEMNSIRLAGTAIAFTNMCTMVGAAVFQPLIGYLLDLHWHGDITAIGTRLYTIDDFRFALAIMPLSYLIASFMSIFLLRESYPHDSLGSKLNSHEHSAE